MSLHFYHIICIRLFALQILTYKCIVEFIWSFFGGGDHTDDVAS